MMQQMLTSGRQLTLGPYKHETDCKYYTNEPLRCYGQKWMRMLTLVCLVEDKKDKTLNAIVSAKNKIRYEINDLKERLKQAKESIAKYKVDITNLEKDHTVHFSTS